MKILSAGQVYLADQHTITHEPVTSVDLMERAAIGCFDWLKENLVKDFSLIHIVCGTGNNGGDGLVIARLFHEVEAQVSVSICRTGGSLSEDFEVNYQRLLDLGVKPLWIESVDDIPSLDKDQLVIDALFGIGLNRPIKDLIESTVMAINESGAMVISIDFPSGLFADKAVDENSSIIKAEHVLTFQVPKLALMLPDNGEYVNDFSIIDIALDQDFIANLDSPYEWITKSMIQCWYRPRSKFSHKGSFGHSLLIGGSFGKIGAIQLATKAAMSAGSGLVSAHIPKCGYIPMQTALPEAMVEVDGENHLEYFNCLKSATAIGIGPGLGLHEKTKKGFVEFLKSNKKPLVIDADALNILSEFEELKSLIPEGSILTPHPKEFARLVGSWNNDFDKLEKLMAFSAGRKVVTVLKGAHTAICDGERIFFNSTGNPGLAKGGSGDVLTGVITGLRAQGYPPLEAACMGVYIHGDSADRLIGKEKSQETLMASDLIDGLSACFKELVDNHGIKFDR